MSSYATPSRQAVLAAREALLESALPPDDVAAMAAARGEDPVAACWSCEALSETALRDAIEVHTSDDMALKDCLP